MSLHFPWQSMFEAGLHQAESDSPSVQHAKSAAPVLKLSGPASPPANDSREQLIAAQNEARTKFAPGPRGGTTHCNGALCFTGRAMHVPMEPFENSRGVPYTANQIAQNLATSRYYRDVTPEEAQTLGNSGAFVVGAHFHPQGHGHVVTVRPEGVAGDTPFGLHGPLLNDIGKFDRIARQSGAFPAGDQVHYYTPYAGGAH